MEVGRHLSDGLPGVFDHTFVTARHRAWVLSCDYLHAPRQDGLSDHAAMFLTLDLAGTAAGPPPVTGVPSAAFAPEDRRRSDRRE